MLPTYIIFSMSNNAQNQSNSISQPNLLNRFTSGLPSLLSSKTKSIDETIAGTNNFLNSMNPLSNNVMMGNHVSHGGGVQQHNMPNHHNVNQQQGAQHRRLPATPNKPSTLFSQTASSAFKSISNQFNSQVTKPSTLSFR